MKDLSALKTAFIERFKRHQRLRLHMSLILLATVCSGILATRLLLALHLKNVMVRYPLAVLLAYLTFFICVKLWLKFVVSVAVAGGRRESSGTGFNLVSGSSGGSSPTGEAFRGGGGGFGGGGASGSFAEVPAALAESGAEVVSGGTEAAGGVAEAAGGAAGEAASGVDLDKGCLVVAVLALIAAAIFGAGIYLIYAAPYILSEAAFQVILAAGLARGARRLQSGDWLGSVFRATWIPLAITLLLSLLAGYLIHHFFPGVTRLSELLTHF